MNNFISNLIKTTKNGQITKQTNFDNYLEKTVATVEKEMMTRAEMGYTYATVIIDQFNDGTKDIYTEITRHFKKLGIRVQRLDYRVLRLSWSRLMRKTI